MEWSNLMIKRKILFLFEPIFFRAKINNTHMQNKTKQKKELIIVILAYK